jgi:hypothetical protein
MAGSFSTVQRGVSEGGALLVSAAMFRGLRFGKAWIDTWTRVLGAGDPDTFLRHGVGVKGAVYRQ